MNSWCGHSYSIIWICWDMTSHFQELPCWLAAVQNWVHHKCLTQTFHFYSFTKCYWDIQPSFSQIVRLSSLQLPKLDWLQENICHFNKWPKTTQVYVQETKPSSGRSNYEGSKERVRWCRYRLTKSALRGDQSGWMGQQNICCLPWEAAPHFCSPNLNHIYYCNHGDETSCVKRELSC